MRTVTTTERRARLARRHALAPDHRRAAVEETADAVVALHATDQPTIYLAAWARAHDLVHADVDAALYDDRTLIKHLCMRRTLFVFRPALLGAIQSAVSARVAASECRRLIQDVERGGLQADGATWLEQAQAATLAHLDEVGSATARELTAAVPELTGMLVYAPDKSYGGKQSVAPRVLTTLGASGQVLRGPNRGAWTLSRPTWVHTRSWLGADPELPDPDVAIDDLIGRYLIAFGPVTERDVKWWFGSTLGIVRASLKRIGAVEVDLGDEVVGYLHPDDTDEVVEVAPYAVLLPGLDPTTMGWYDRTWYLGDHRPQIFDSNGNGGPTAWWDGRIVGGWRQDAEGIVEIQPLERLPRAATGALAAEAARLTEWLAGTAFRPSFPSPLSQQT